VETSTTDNRQRIISAARELFYQQGYNATSFSDIAQRAEIPRGNFYYYFKSKDEILLGVIDSWLAFGRASLENLEAASPDPCERMRGFVRSMLPMLDNIRQHGCPFGSLNTELRKDNNEEGLRDRARELFDMYRAWLETQFCASGQEEDAGMLALHLMGRLQGASVMTNAYQQPDYFENEITLLEAWISKVCEGQRL